MTNVQFLSAREARAHAMSSGCGCGACEAAGAGLPRRAFLALGAAASLAAVPAFLPSVARAEEKLSPDAALARLAAGNERYAKGDMTSFKLNLAKLRAQTVDGQAPFAAVLSCADSRVPVEIVFDESIGSIFVTRVAGNVANTETIASLEYGVAELHVPAILVLAHQNCGAVKAAIAGEAVPGQISALYAPLQAAVAQGGGDPAATAKLNAKLQAQMLAKASPLLAEAIAKNELKIAAGYYELGSGRVIPVT
ncbi:MAG TPA: carbonic anhydrase [Caulobacteraceae bacterium]|nr:carbonic anhydrase [Caulobacteraceae bacterium]